MNKTKLIQILDHYYKKFDNYWEQEEYKLREVLNFQKLWNINDPDFVSMLDHSINNSSNLLAS